MEKQHPGGIAFRERALRNVTGWEVEIKFSEIHGVGFMASAARPMIVHAGMGGSSYAKTTFP